MSQESTMKLPLQITLPCKDNKKVRIHLENILCNDVIGIIISYYDSSWCWKYVESKNVINYAAHCIMNNNIIGIHRTDTSDVLKFDPTGDIEIDANQMNQLLYCDPPYIYIYNEQSNVIMAIHYYNKNYSNLKILCSVNLTQKINLTLYMVNEVMRCIKNDIIYICNMDTDPHSRLLYNSLVVLEQHSATLKFVPTTKYSLKNISVYYDYDKQQVSTNVSDSNTEHHSCGIYVSDSNEIIVTLDHTHQNEISKIKFENTEIWCIVSPSYTKILYSDDHEILYLQRESIICYDKQNGESCNYNIKACGDITANKEIMFFEDINRIHIYKLINS